MIYYTGDIHGSAKGIVAFAQHYELTESDIIVILGDVGANYYGNRRDRYCKDALAKIKPTVFCVHGNHERRPDTLAGYKQKEWNGGLVWYEDEYPNLLFARDGDVFTMEGTRHLVIGGAYSVDKYYRLENNLLWFADEQPSAEIKTYAEACPCIFGRKHITAGIRGCQNEKTAATIRNGTHRANPARRKTG